MLRHAHGCRGSLKAGSRCQAGGTPRRARPRQPAHRCCSSTPRWSWYAARCRLLAGRRARWGGVDHRQARLLADRRSLTIRHVAGPISRRALARSDETPGAATFASPVHRHGPPRKPVMPSSSARVTPRPVWPRNRAFMPAHGARTGRGRRESCAAVPVVPGGAAENFDKSPRSRSVDWFHVVQLFTTVPPLRLKCIKAEARHGALAVVMAARWACAQGRRRALSPTSGCRGRRARDRRLRHRPRPPRQGKVEMRWIRGACRHDTGKPPDERHPIHVGHIGLGLDPTGSLDPVRKRSEPRTSIASSSAGHLPIPTLGSKA